MLLRGMGWEALRYHEVFGGTRSTVYGKPITGLEGKGEGKVEVIDGKEWRGYSFWNLSNYMVPGSMTGSMRSILLEKGVKRWELLKEENIYLPLQRILKW